jgi:hypothetical protein
MMIYMLAAAMTVAMLIATAFGLHQEAERARARSAKRVDGFALRSNKPQHF